MKEQKFGVEIELTGITRAKAADVIAKYFGTTKTYDGGDIQSLLRGRQAGQNMESDARQQHRRADERWRDGKRSLPNRNRNSRVRIRRHRRHPRDTAPTAAQRSGRQPKLRHPHPCRCKQTDSAEFKKPGQHHGGKGRPAVQGTRCNAESGNAVV